MINISNVINQIDGTIEGETFNITFCKKNGELREMTATKRNRDRKKSGKSKKGTPFNYSLQEKYALMLNEMPGEKPKTPNIYSIMFFKGEKVNHG